MFLEKLEIFGFKSIPHKLNVRFGSKAVIQVRSND